MRSEERDGKKCCFHDCDESAVHSFLGGQGLFIMRACNLRTMLHISGLLQLDCKLWQSISRSSRRRRISSGVALS